MIVNANRRGRGLGRAIVQLALDEASALGPPCAVLFSNDDRVGLYLKLGFQVVGEEVLVCQPHGQASMHQRTMWRLLRDGFTWPTGPVMVHSLPF